MKPNYFLYLAIFSLAAGAGLLLPKKATSVISLPSTQSSVSSVATFPDETNMTGSLTDPSPLKWPAITNIHAEATITRERDNLPSTLMILSLKAGYNFCQAGLTPEDFDAFIKSLQSGEDSDKWLTDHGFK